jgi:hypothetical protein
MTDAQLTEAPISMAPHLQTRARALGALLRRHLALVVLVGAATMLRALALVAVYPGIWFSDANEYLEVATTGRLSVVRVQGYALFVAPFLHLGSAAALIIVQHLLGLAIVVVLYALLLRRSVPKLIAILAVVPAALDGYLIALEHMIMSETVFHAAVVGAVALLLWRERLGLLQAGVGGLLLGYAGIVRSVAVPFVAVFLAYLLVRRVGLYRVLVFSLGWALVIGGYLTMFKIQHGEFAFTRWEGRFLYAKVAPFAKCEELGALPSDERAFCPDPNRKYSSNGYLWGKGSPIHGVPLSEDARIRDFAMRVIRHEPLTYVKVVTRDTLHYFEPAHRTGKNDYGDSAWQFPSDPRYWKYPGYRGPIREGTANRLHTIDPSQYVNGMVDQPHTNVPASRFLHHYQRFFYTSGQLLAACLVLVLLALFRRAPGSFRLRLDATLLPASALTALIVASALSIFDFRYGLVAVILLPVAGALAGAALLGRADPAPAAPTESEPVTK